MDCTCNDNVTCMLAGQEVLQETHFKNISSLFYLILAVAVIVCFVLFIVRKTVVMM